VCSFAALTLHALDGAQYAYACACGRGRRSSSSNRQSRNRSRANHQSIDYDRTVPQSGPTNPHRSAPIQNHLSKTKKQNWLFKLPFTPAGVKGRGGSGGQISEG
jgi:hypothetical protein